MEHLQNMGIVSSGINGMIPLSFSEIWAYMQSTKTDLHPEEVMIIRKMSQAYVMQSKETQPNVDMPYATKKTEIKLSHDQVLRAFGF